MDFQMKTAVAAIALVAIANAPAFAQNLNAGAQADSASESSASVDAYSGSQAVVIQNASGELKYSGSYEVRNNPSVGAPGIIAGYNCALGASGGASGGGFGVSFGGAYVDRGCELRAEAGAILTVGGNKAAILHLARDPEMCETFRQAGMIPLQSLCSEAEKKAAAKAQRDAARVSTRSAVPAAPGRKSAPSNGLTQCEKRDGKVYIGYKFDADKAVAKATCLSALGY